MKGLPRSNARGLKTAQTARKLTINVKALQVAITDPGAAVGYGSAVAGRLPEGNILILGAVANLVLSSASAGIITTFLANFSVGQAATADATLTLTDADIIPSTATSAATAKVSPLTRGASANPVVPVMIDNTDSSKNVNMNVTVPDASLSANSTMQVDGQIYIAYVILGDD